MLLTKWGIKSLFKYPLKTIITILLIFFAVCATGLFKMIMSYQPLDFEKSCYYSEDISDDSLGFADSIYMNYVYGNLSLSATRKGLPKSKVKELTDELHSLGQGYSVDYIVSKENYSYTIGAPDTFFGLYGVENYIAKETTEASLYNDDGELAPFFTFTRSVSGAFGSSADIVRTYMTLFKNYSVAYDMNEASLKAYGYDLYGKFPEKIDEVTIPWYLYNSFKTYGYKNGADGEKEEINSPEDIIGKELLLNTNRTGKQITAKIVGVLNTNQDLSVYLDMERLESGENLYYLQLKLYGYSPVTSVYVSEEYYDKYKSDDDYCTYVSVLRRSSESLQDSYFEIGTRWRTYMTLEQLKRDTGLHIMYDMGPVESVLSVNVAFNVLSQEPFPTMSEWIIPLSAVLSAFLLSLNVAQSRRQISVLRMLGASRTNIFVGYLLPIIVLIVAAYVAGGVGAIVSCIFVMKASLGSVAEQFHVSAPIYEMSADTAGALAISCAATVLFVAAALWITVRFIKMDRKSANIKAAKKQRPSAAKK